VSAIHAELVATPAGVHLRDRGSRNGTFVAGVRVVEGYLRERCVVSLGGTELEFSPLGRERLRLGDESRLGRLVGGTAKMRALFAQIRRVAPTPLTVLIQGETGTGKELVARALHELGPRAKRPFVVVDCGALAPTLAESALFGHERGAFTGATARRISPFVEAQGGTVFLDELGELPLDVQPKLLRALAESRVKALGANEYRTFDARVVAATRRDLVRGVNDGTFRSDLYFRIAQVSLALPSLRRGHPRVAWRRRAALSPFRSGARTIDELRVAR
jgi:transcriptional regulator with GAF, ATPase, and Fis domain